MPSYGVCKRCGSTLAVLDMMLEAYDLVCMRCPVPYIARHRRANSTGLPRPRRFFMGRRGCGMREVIDRAMVEAPPCYQ